MREYEIDRGQLDGLWSYVGHKKKTGEEEDQLEEDQPEGKKRTV